MEGAKEMLFKNGPRPDVGVRFTDGSVKAIEVASKTDKVVALTARNELKIAAEGLKGSASVNTWAVTLQKWFGR